MKNRSICFVTGTRADFGKLKSLIRAASSSYDVRIFITGMHMLAKYGSTYHEVIRSFELPVHKYVNQREGDALEVVLSKTISGFSDYLREDPPDLVVVHGDRIETLACSMAACFSGLRVGHVEGGEVSGTMDEIIRHAVSKVSHAHFVCNEQAAGRLRQLGETPESIFVIGSPDLDVMSQKDLASIGSVRNDYAIPFDEFGLCLFHPVVTELDQIEGQAHQLVQAMIRSEKNYVVISPNNDPGSHLIFDAYRELEGNCRFIHRPSIRFEAFLVLLKNAALVLGNSSAGVRETSFYGVSSLNLGTRQQGRANAPSIRHIPTFVENELVRHIHDCWGKTHQIVSEFGDGKSDVRFRQALNSSAVWSLAHQKNFVDIDLSLSVQAHASGGLASIEDEKMSPCGLVLSSSEEHFLPECFCDGDGKSDCGAAPATVSLQLDPV